MKHAIRPATELDRAALVELINDSYLVEAFFVRGDRISLAEVAVRQERGLFLVADSPGKRIDGCVHVTVEADRGAFGLLSVSPEAQGNGLGKRLIEAAEDHCRQAGCRSMQLLVVDLRAELPPWYRRLGYRECGTEPFHDRERLIRPCHFLVMAKEL